MILAQSAATAAVFSIDDNLSVQDIPYEKLKKRLILDNQILELKKTELVTSGLGPIRTNLVV